MYFVRHICNFCCESRIITLWYININQQVFYAYILKEWRLKSSVSSSILTISVWTFREKCAFSISKMCKLITVAYKYYTCELWNC